MHAPTRAVLALVVLGASCAMNTSQEHIDHPIPRRYGMPHRIDILGASYTIPARFDTPDHHKEPGLFIMSYVDQVSGCAGTVFFHTTSEEEKHVSLTTKQLEGIKSRFRANKVGFQADYGEVALLGAQAKHTTLALSKGGDQASLGFVDHHYPELQLSLAFSTFCQEPGLMQQTEQQVIEMLNTHDQAQDPGTATPPAP